ncbi:MAG: recombinase family protein [Gammaproteobacteria bacterium]
MTKTAVIYARVSTVRQAEDELPLASQIEQCAVKATALDATVARTFADEGLSGRVDTRPAFQDAIAYCEAFSVDYFITWSTSRFARNKIDAGMYKLRLARAGTDIVYVTLSIDRGTDGGWMTESVLELFDEFYSRQISADTRRSMIKNANDGHWNGGVPPFGFEAAAAGDNEKRRRLRPVPTEVDIVRRIFALRLEGYGAKSIAILLSDDGLTNRGRAWNKSTVAALLRNQAAIGNTVFGRRDRATARRRDPSQWIVVRSHEPIIDQQTWAEAQLVMGEDAPTADGSPHSTFAFTGILRCGRCGSSMQIESAKGRSRRYHYYNCRAKQKHGQCVNRRLAARELDAWLIDVVLDNLLTEENLRGVMRELYDAYGSWAIDQRRRRKAVAEKLAGIQRKNEKLYELFELHGKSAPNLSDLTARLRANNAEVKRAEAELQGIDAEQAPEIEITQEDLADLVAALRDIIHTTTNEKKLRHFFSSFISGIYVEDDQVRIEYRPEYLMHMPESVVPGKVMWLPGTGSNRRPND